MTNLLPGKGFFGTANEETLRFLYDAISDVEQAYTEAGGDPAHDEDPNRILKALLAKVGWSGENDKFGKKAFKSIPIGEGGAYRVTLVLTNRGELKVDIRNWYDADA